jgi:phosphoribosylformimino-5-aminoimidazole carboxamide ribotide isomerase
MLHVVDLDGAFSESNGRNREVLRDIVRAVSIPVQFGGGLRGAKDLEQAISLGVARVVIGTLAVESPDMLAKFVELFGVDHVAVGIDARNGQVVTRGWETEEEMSALTLARRVAAAGVERIIYTDVSRDGTLAGVNIDQTCLIAETSGLKVTASGGVASLADLERLGAVSHCGVDSVIVGKALYEGCFTLPDAIAVCA